MADVRRIFPAVPNDIRDWTRYLSGLFFARSFTATLTGCTTAPTGIIKYTASAGIVALSIPTILATSNTTGGSLTGLPEEIRPPNTGLAKYVVVPIVDNGTSAFGLIAVNHTDTISLLTGAAGGGFTAAGQKGIRSIVALYSLD
jgi:hypothetical protein